MDTGEPARYDGPLRAGANRCPRSRARARTTPRWNRDGLRADNEYRDLGLAAATGGRIGVKHIRAIKPFAQPTGWHWHDMTGAFRRTC